MYDIIYIKPVDAPRDQYEIFKKKYPFSKLVEYTNKNDAVKKAFSKSFTNMFWLIEDGALIEGNLDYRVSSYDINYVHGKVCLLSKKNTLPDHEIFEVFNKTNENFSVVSKLTPINTYDMFFISYNELNADQNFLDLKNRFPKAKRIHGIRGIHLAHKEAALQSNTEFFWVVDGDSKITDTFNFDFIIPPNSLDTVFVWRSINPVNDLQYGYGGVKLLPKKKLLGMNDFPIDMTTSISEKIKSIPEVSNITEFNVDPFSSWRSAFRECVKLSSKIISNQVDSETENRLEIWCTVGQDRPYGDYTIRGAIMGKAYGTEHKNNPEALAKINDWKWLENEFKKL